MSARGLATVLVLVLAHAAAAQEPGLSEAEFLSGARSAAARYRDRGAAVADGFRPVGPDAPAMGQHWVSVRRILNGHVDPAFPAVLMYAEVGGVPTLVGVGYAVALPAGAALPTVPQGSSHWHVHSSSLLEEGVGSNHAMTGVQHADRFGVAVLHAWVGTANPAGAWAPDNWALPFARLGWVMPPGTPFEAAKALSLAIDAGYYKDRLALLADLDQRDEAAAAGVLADEQARVRKWLSARRAVAEADVPWLVNEWKRLQRAAHAAVSPGASRRLEAVSW